MPVPELQQTSSLAGITLTCLVAANWGKRCARRW